MTDTHAAQAAEPQGKSARKTGKKRGEYEKTRVRRARAARGGKLMPLEYALALMRNPSPKISDARRDWACATAMPFCHSRLNSIDHGVKNEALDAIVELFSIAKARSQGGVTEMLTGPAKRRALAAGKK